MQEIEEDPEVRQQVALFKNDHAKDDVEQRSAGDVMDIDDELSGDEAELDIPLEELIDELEALGVE